MKEDDRKLLGLRLVQGPPENTAHRKLALRLSRMEDELDSSVGEKGPEETVKAFRMSLERQAVRDVVNKVFHYYCDQKTSGPRVCKGDRR